jgi:hypothetical protein
MAPRAGNQGNSGGTSDDTVKLAVMANDMTYLKNAVDSIDKKISSGYVTKEEFDPIKRIVYGLISLVLVAVVGALLALVVK